MTGSGSLYVHRREEEEEEEPQKTSITRSGVFDGAAHTRNRKLLDCQHHPFFLFSIPLYSYITYISLVRYQMENIVTRADGRCAFEPLISPVVNQKKEDK